MSQVAAPLVGRAAELAALDAALAEARGGYAGRARWSGPGRISSAVALLDQTRAVEVARCRRA